MENMEQTFLFTNTSKSSPTVLSTTHASPCIYIYKTLFPSSLLPSFHRPSRFLLYFFRCYVFTYFCSPQTYTILSSVCKQRRQEKDCYCFYSCTHFVKLQIYFQAQFSWHEQLMHCEHVTLLKLMARYAARQVEIQSGVVIFTMT
jgi:hypothetical protein